MAVQRFKLGINNSRFPLVSTKAQRAVMVPGLDAAGRTQRSDQSALSTSAQLVYCENVMPVGEGLHSVGYSEFIPAHGSFTGFDSIFALRDASENTVLYSPAGGANYLYLSGAWTTSPYANIVYPLTLADPSALADSKVTYAYVEGLTFICFSRLKSSGTAIDLSILVWDGSQLQRANPYILNLPFDPGTIDGISASSGYLLVYSGIEVAWAPLTGGAFDFTLYADGAFTGAGSATPDDIKGAIRAVIPVAGGFAMFTDRNAVAAHYHSQNIQSPWVFREIANCGGLESYEQATVEGTLGNVYAYTTAGLQSISLNSAETVFPDVSDFIAAQQIERYNADSHTMYQGALSLDFYIRLTNVGNRYLVISYGTFKDIYSFALIYDMALQRWGKLRTVHRDCFYFAYGVTVGSLAYSALGDVTYADMAGTTYADASSQSNAFVAAPHGVAFLEATGRVIVADWSDSVKTIQDSGVAVLGRVQLTRTSNVQINRVEAEGLKAGNIYIQPSYDGRTLADVESLVDVGSVDDLALKGCMIDCKNFNLIVEGAFDLSTIIVEAKPSGRF